eukprot:323272_1
MFSRLNSQAAAKCAYCNEEFKHQHELVAHVMESHIVSIFDGGQSEENSISTDIFATQSRTETIEQRNHHCAESFTGQTDSTDQKVAHSGNSCDISFKKEELLT